MNIIIFEGDTLSVNEFKCSNKIDFNLINLGWVEFILNFSPLLLLLVLWFLVSLLSSSLPSSSVISVHVFFNNSFLIAWNSLLWIKFFLAAEYVWLLLIVCLNGVNTSLVEGDGGNGDANFFLLLFDLLISYLLILIIKYNLNGSWANCLHEL